MDSLFLTNILDKESKRSSRANGASFNEIISSNTLRHEYTQLVMLFKKMKLWGYIEFNPMSDDVLKKYVKLYKKFAKPAENNDILKRSNDASNLVNIFNKYSESMNKDTAYAFFDELKRTSMNYRHFHDVKFSAGLISDMTDGEKEDFACEIETQEAKLYDRYKRLKRNKNM